jgi:glyoxylase-like metal-dependent hydrolase (beta-lactamase superfamily II)
MSEPTGEDARYTVTAVRYGTLAMNASEAFYRWESYREPDRPRPLDYFFWVLRGARETLLVDTGFSPAAAARRGRACLIEPIAAMELLGVGPQTVSRVLLTHLHYDHVGNLAPWAAAELLVPARELEFWTSPTSERYQFVHSIERSEIAQVVTATREGRVTLLEGGETVAPGVRVHVLGGHSPGQVALTVPTDEGLVVLASDAVHFYEELDDDRPFAVIHNLAETYEAYDVIRELGAAPGASILAGHDPEVMARFAPAAGAAGEFAIQIGREPAPAS